MSLVCEGQLCNGLTETEYYYDFSPENAVKVDTEPDALTFGYVVKAYAILGDLEGALAAFQDCKNRNLKPTARTYALLVELCANHNKRELGEELINEAENTYEKPVAWYNPRLVLNEEEATEWERKTGVEIPKAEQTEETPEKVVEANLDAEAEGADEGEATETAEAAPTLAKNQETIDVDEDEEDPRTDIEFLNAKMYFYGKNDPAAAEKVVK